MTLPLHSRQILGRSVQQRPVEGVFFGGKAEAIDRLDTLFVGAFHGDETISAALMQCFVRYLQVGRFRGAAVDLRKKPVLVIPALNPDGLAARTRVNANGVDLNRNYPTPDFVESNPGSKYYSGPVPASEPETRLMTGLIERYRPCKLISVHSPYKVINFDGPARALADRMAETSGYPVVESIGYPTPGSFGTYAGALRQIPVITLELPPGFDEPPEEGAAPPESLAQVWESNLEALEAAIRF